MSTDSTIPDPPEDLPTEIGEVLRAHATDQHGLQETIIYAKELLNTLQGSEWPMEPIRGEEFVQVTERDGYTEVVKRLKKGGDAYLFHVHEEPQPGGEKNVHWTLVGRMESDEP